MSSQRLTCVLRVHVRRVEAEVDKEGDWHSIFEPLHHVGLAVQGVGHVASQDDVLSCSSCHKLGLLSHSVGTWGEKRLLINQPTHYSNRRWVRVIQTSSNILMREKQPYIHTLSIRASSASLPLNHKHFFNQISDYIPPQNHTFSKKIPIKDWTLQLWRLRNTHTHRHNPTLSAEELPKGSDFNNQTQRENLWK